MQLRLDIQLRAMIKSLSDVVVPAVDSNNKLALEQIQLTIGLLALMEQRQPLQFRFDCDELARLLRLADELTHHVSNGGASAALDRVALASSVGADVFDRARADPTEVLDAIRELRSACGQAVDSIYRDGDDAARSKLKKVVLSTSEAQLLRDRSWVSPQGWEPHPESIPAIEDLLSSK